jgi:hypothetical protein
MFFEKPRIRHPRSVEQFAERFGATPTYLWHFTQDSAATSGDDLVSGETLTEVGTPVWANVDDTMDSRTVLFNSDGDGLEAASDAIFDTGAGQFAVYIEGILPSGLGSVFEFASKAASNVGWTITMDSTNDLEFALNNNTYKVEIPSVNGYFRGLFIYRAIEDELEGPKWQIEAYSNFGHADPVEIGTDGAGVDLSNAGLFTLGKSATTSPLWDARGTFCMVALFEGDEVDDLSWENVEALAESKGYV